MLEAYQIQKYLPRMKIRPVPLARVYRMHTVLCVLSTMFYKRLPSQHELSQARGWCSINVACWRWGYLSSEPRLMSNPELCDGFPFFTRNDLATARGQLCCLLGLSRILFFLPSLGRLAYVHEVKPCFLTNGYKLQLRQIFWG